MPDQRIDITGDVATAYFAGGNIIINNYGVQHEGPPPGDGKIRVFISYNWNDADKALAEKLFTRLNAEPDIIAWRDEENLPHRGNTLRDELRQAIARADRVLPIVSPASVARAADPSSNLALEWAFARRVCKAFTPVVNGDSDADPKTFMPPDFYAVPWLDFRDEAQFEATIEKLIRTLKEKASPPGPLIGVSMGRVPPGALQRTAYIAQVQAALGAEGQPSIIASGLSPVKAIAPGGLGKSVLAAMVAANCQIRRSFPDGVVWVDVGPGATEEQVCGDIAAAFGYPRDQFNSAISLNTVLQGRTALIIYDDAWDRKLMETCCVMAGRVRYLITTRQRSLLNVPASHKIVLGYLSDDEGADLIAGRITSMTSPAGDGEPGDGWRTSADLWEKLKPLAREMRRDPTPAEQALWQALRNRQLKGYKFRRQHSIERFIVDFYCAEAALVVEVDGSSHDEPDQRERDAIRDAFLAEQGFRMLRVTNAQVLNDLPAVLKKIEAAITSPPAPLSASREGEPEGVVSPPSPSTERGLGGEVKAADYQLYRQISAALDGHTLAIDICAARLANRDPADPAALLAELQRGDSALLETLKREIAAEDREDNFLISFSLSYENMPADIQGYFRQLGVFSALGSFDAAAAAAVWEVDEAKATSILRYLVNRALLDEREGDRYRVHMLLRAAARTLLADDEHSAAARRHADYYAHLGYKHGGSLGTASALFPETEQLEAAFAWAEGEKDADLCFRLAWRYRNSAMLRGRLAANHQRLQTALNLQTGEDDATLTRRAKLYGGLADIAYQRGEIHEAEDLQKKSREAYDKAGDRRGEAVKLGKLAEIAMRRGDLAAAERLAREYVEIAKEVGDRREVGVATGKLAEIAMQRGDLASAERLHRESMAIDEEVGDRRGVGVSKGALADIAFQRGDLASAERLFTEAQVIMEQVGDKRAKGVYMGKLAEIAMRRGDLASAERLYKEAQVIMEQVGEKRTQGVLLGKLADLAMRRGDLAAAERLHRESMAIDEEVGDRRGVGVSKGALAEIAMQRGDFAAAERLHRESMAIDEEVGDRRGVGVSKIILGDIALQRGDSKSAEQLYKEGQIIMQQVGDKQQSGVVLGKLADIAMRRGDLASAERLYKEKIAIMEQIGDRREMAVAQWNLGLFYINQGQKDEGCAMLVAVQREAAAMGLGEAAWLAEQIEKICG